MKRPKAEYLLIILIVLVCIINAAEPVIAGESSSSAAKQIDEISKMYRMQIELASKDQGMLPALTSAADCWALATSETAKRLKANKTESFLKMSRNRYDMYIAKSSDSVKNQIYAMNYLYQCVNAAAYTLCQANGDSEALESINMTEQRVAEVFKRTEASGSALAALSGGVLSMLAITAGQLDNGQYRAILEKEFHRRRKIDANIAGLQNTEPGKKIILLTNNHIQGSFSMVQIIGLLLNKDIKPAIRKIEAELIKHKDKNVDLQLLEGAKAFAEMSFIATRSFAEIQPPISQ